MGLASRQGRLWKFDFSAVKTERIEQEQTEKKTELNHIPHVIRTHRGFDRPYQAHLLVLWVMKAVENMSAYRYCLLIC